MQPIAVFASASSRLHADLLVTRLKRAGIPPHRISAVYPIRLKPNCALCWLDGESRPGTLDGEAVVVAGALHAKLNLASAAAFAADLEGFGLTSSEANACTDQLQNGQILLGVEAINEAEVALAWHTFHELKADGIAVGVGQPQRKRGWFQRPRRTRAAKTHRRHAPGFAIGAAASA